MKNLLLILAFVFISLTGFSQTFTLSSYTSGTKQQSYTVSIPQGNGYNYSYSVIATYSTSVIVSQYKGTLAWLSNTTRDQKQSSGSGQVLSGAGYDPNYKQYQDVIRLIISNEASYSYGYAQISVSPW